MKTDKCQKVVTVPGFEFKEASKMQEKIEEDRQLSFSRKYKVYLKKMPRLSMVLVLFGYCMLFHWNRNIPENAGGNAGLAEALLAYTIVARDAFAVLLLCAAIILSIIRIIKAKDRIISIIGILIIILALFYIVRSISVFGTLGPPEF